MSGLRIYRVWIGVGAAIAVAWGAGCGQDFSDLPPNRGGDPFWEPIDLGAATDLGHVPQPIPPAEQVAAGDIALVDVTDQAGLGAAVGGGNTHGVGVAFVDVDGDELPDIFVANGRSNVTGASHDSALYRNRGDGTFEDVSGASGVSAILGGRDCYSIAAGDYDLDGDVDLYVGAQPTDVLLRNGGDGTFTDATAEAGAGGPPSDPSLVGDGRSKIVAFGDFDADGDLDLVSASSTLPPPMAYLLRNDGDGTFTDDSAATGVKAHPSGNPCAVMWSDYDNDGDPDLHIWNDRGGHVLLRNDGGTRLSDVTEASGLDAVNINHPMGIDAADIDRDGDLDYYVSNIGDNPLLRNNGDGTFSDITRFAGTGGTFGWGLSFQDFDADGLVDIFVAQEDELPHIVFHNVTVDQDQPSFAERPLSHEPVVNTSAAHNVAAAFADYDRDGRVDVVVAHTDGGRIDLFHNETELGTSGWIHVTVRVPDGSASSEGIGARVGVGVGDVVQFRDITGGSSRASQSELAVTFGLGQVTGADWVAVLWPDGRQQVVTGVEARQHIVLTADDTESP